MQYLVPDKVDDSIAVIGPCEEGPSSILDTRKKCEYGMKCYRKKKSHFEELSHPVGHPKYCPPPDFEEMLKSITSSKTAKERSRARPVCPKGTKCLERDEAHLASLAHPFDLDYFKSCTACGQQPVTASLKGLFEWADTKGIGKVSREQLQTVLPLIARLEGAEGEEKDEYAKITDAAWADIDQDGNGVINLGEFARWAGPRLGLPYGIQAVAKRSSLVDTFTNSCKIMGCSCDEWVSGETVSMCECEIKLPMDVIPGKTEIKVSTTTGVEIALIAPVGVAPGSLIKARYPLTVCKFCKHKATAHTKPRKRRSERDMLAKGSVPVPAYWAYKEARADGEHHMVDLDSRYVELFQKLLDETYRNIFTRDRRKHATLAHTDPRVPTGFKVVNAKRNENHKAWLTYYFRRSALDAAVLEAERGMCDSFEVYDSKASEAWKKIAEQKAGTLIQAANEWYLFHGTSPAAAVSICESDFRISCAGSATGTLYGRGCYFAESITKADEYAKPDDNGVHAVLLTRVLGGKVRYCDEETPDAEKLTKDCIEGAYDCVLGDREKIRGTYKEYIVFDSENLYPEYIIEYERIYPAEH